ncbi:MAG: helix-turn-helix transcriptional regulator [Lysobacterales bacterium]
MTSTSGNRTNTRNKSATQPAPHAKFWRLPTVCGFVELSRSTLLRRVKAKDFPSPVKLGSGPSVAWVAAEVQDWAAARIAERDEANNGGAR